MSRHPVVSDAFAKVATEGFENTVRQFRERVLADDGLHAADKIALLHSASAHVSAFLTRLAEYDTDDLIPADQVAARLGKSERQLQDEVRQRQFPEPTSYVHAGHFYSDGLWFAQAIERMRPERVREDAIRHAWGNPAREPEPILGGYADE